MSKWNIESKKGIFSEDRITTAKDEKLFSSDFVLKINHGIFVKEDIDSIEHSVVRGIKKYRTIVHYLLGERYVDNDKHEDFMLKMLKEFLVYSKQIVDVSDKLLQNVFRNNDTACKTLINLRQLAGKVTCSEHIPPDRLLYNIDGWCEKLLSSFEENGEISYANTFLNDHNKIVSSSAFRRLQDKAQVFPLEPNDYVRTRLTHSFEVASVAQEISNIVDKKLNKHLSKGTNRFLIERIMECVALIHDIGNPPYGHYGEGAIRKFFVELWKGEAKDIEWENKNDTIASVIRTTSKIVDSQERKENQMYYDFAAFDGNAQSLRVVTKLQRYRHGHPLELSASVLGAVIKYPYDSVTGMKKGKLGYFFSESDVAAMLEALGTLQHQIRNPLCLILEAADDISYMVADMDDAIKKGIITKEIFDNAIKGCDEKIKDRTLNKFFSDYSQYYENNVLEQVEDPFTYTLSLMLYDLKRKMIQYAAKAFCNHFDEIIEGIVHDGSEKANGIHELLEYDENDAKSIRIWLDNYLVHPYIYLSRDVAQAEVKGDIVITTLLKEFTNAMLNLDFSKDSRGNRPYLRKKYTRENLVFSLISKNFVDNFYSEYDNTNDPAEKTYYKLKLVVDYISGMTDTYALECYQILCGTK